jgi:hypothetical protein
MIKPFIKQKPPAGRACKRVISELGKKEKEPRGEDSNT